MNSNKRAPKSLPTCGTIRGAQGLQVQLKNGLAGTKRYADLSAGDAPIAYQSSHPFHSPRVGASRCQTKKKKAGAVLDPTHHQRGCHPEGRSNPSAPRQGIKTASASRKIGRESSPLPPQRRSTPPGAGRDRPGSSTAAPGKTLKRKKPAPHSIQHTISAGAIPRAGRIRQGHHCQCCRFSELLSMTR